MNGNSKGGASEACPDCGKRVPVGGWPFCASPRNPEGHARGTYTWKVDYSMKGHGWTKRPRGR